MWALAPGAKHAKCARNLYLSGSVQNSPGVPSGVRRVCAKCALSRFPTLPPPLNLPSASAWHRDSSPINSNARFNSFWFFAQMVHYICLAQCGVPASVRLYCRDQRPPETRESSPQGLSSSQFAELAATLPTSRLLHIVRLSKLLLLLTGCYTPSPVKV